MSTYDGLVVSFERPLSDEQVDALIAAIRQFRSVTGASRMQGNMEFALAQMRCDQEWRGRIITLLQEQQP